MKTLRNEPFALLTLMAACLISTGAQAAWTLGSAPTTDGTGVELSSSTGVSAANGGTFVNNAATNYGIASFASGAVWATGTLSLYGGGFGMSSDGSASPNHAIDNGPRETLVGGVTTKTGVGNTEAMLLSFNSSVALSSIGIGYKSGDADISLFRFVGNASNPYLSGPTLAGNGANLTSMTSKGWEMVGNYANLAVDSSAPYSPVNATNKGSSWWLISAYNTSYGSGTGLDQGNDYFKLLAVAGTKCTSTAAGVCGGGSTSVPEPASLALASAALLGALGIRRRRPEAATAAAKA